MQVTISRSLFPIACLLLGLLADSQPGHATECKVITTRLNGSTFFCEESPGGLCADGVIWSGILKGTKLAVYTAEGPSAGLPDVEPPWVLSYAADAVFTTDQGELHLDQLGVLDPLRQVFTELSRVVGGTGRFEDATGDLFISGTTSIDGSAFESDVTGTLCLSE